ncbi:hypothetical protein NUM_07290 [Actinocatenispora comari]|uniref:Uncharacterized protein n=1 Tax=Actinocatenispora comari TaxID=2807577 RepID=A0A8J4A868_9ACTN|nr:hypothetical protein NUM_07290 [Actinocatenispora comari]
MTRQEDARAADPPEVAAALESAGYEVVPSTADPDGALQVRLPGRRALLRRRRATKIRALASLVAPMGWLILPPGLVPPGSGDWVLLIHPADIMGSPAEVLVGRDMGAWAASGSRRPYRRWHGPSSRPERGHQHGDSTS